MHAASRRFRSVGQHHRRSGPHPPSGRERRDDAPAQALTVPLVTKADGTKFGKTASGAVWLASDLTSPYAFYQFWFNTDDRDLSRFLRLFSLRPPNEIAELEAASAAAPPRGSGSEPWHRR